MKLRRFAAIVIVLLLCTISATYVKASPSSDSAAYREAIHRLKTFGIMDENSFGQGGAEGIITREEFTKALAIAAGLESDASYMMGPTIFTDIEPTSSASGYINAAVEKGLMTGMMDGKFHPEGSVTFAQACTIMVRALSYTDSDLKGMWPKNYITQAKTLGIAAGINLKNNDGLPRWAATLMFDNLLDTSIKKTNPTDADKTYAASSGIASESYVYGGISSPVYSRPVIVANFDPASRKIGDIDLSGNPRIIKDGAIIGTYDIEDGDVAYEVSDVLGTKRYILVVDDRVEGKITAISPNTIQLDSKDYNFSKVNSSYNDFKVDDYASLYLGYDGKVAGFFDIEHQDNGNFALVINSTYENSSYIVKLLLIDGTIRTYDADTSYLSYKGRLVNYTKISDDKVSLTDISYSGSAEYEIDKAERLIGDSYVSHNVKIFNLISSSVTQDQDVVANIVRWSDMPAGTIASGKILHMNKAGAFNDVNVMLVNDLQGDNYKAGIVKSVMYKTTTTKQLNADGSQKVDGSGVPLPDIVVKTADTCTVVIDGKDYNVNDSYGAGVGSAVKVDFASTSSGRVYETMYSVSSSSSLSVVDVNRIKIYDTAYTLSDNLQVYFRSNTGSYTLKSIKDIEEGKSYGYIYVYLDKSLSDGGKVSMIIVQQ